MATDRRYGNQDFDPRDREDDGYIARRGFGNRSAGYERRSDEDEGRRTKRRHAFQPHRCGPRESRENAPAQPLTSCAS